MYDSLGRGLAAGRQEPLYSIALSGFRGGERPPNFSESGLSLVESLVAAALFLLLALGVMPLFTRSVFNNLEGSESTEMANFALSRVEDLLALPFEDPRLTVPAGQRRLDTPDYFEMEWQVEGESHYFVGKGWTVAAPAADLLRWQRRTTVEQYSVSDLKDNDRLDTPLDGSVDPVYVHFKRITVNLTNPRTGRPAMAVRQMKSTGPKAF